jgi:nucleotide-binding universal stress UspA family protein
MDARVNRLSMLPGRRAGVPLFQRREREDEAVGAMRVLMATDGSKEAVAACRFLSMLPLTPGSAIQVASVVTDRLFPGYEVYWTLADQVLRAERDRAERVAQVAAETLAREGIEVTTAVRSGTPAREILQAAEEFDAGMVVLGSKGLTGLEGFLLGSVARTVAKRCERPVLVARAPRSDLREVILAVDGSDHAAHAVQFGACLPLPEGARRTLVHVVRPFRSYPDYLYLDPEEHQTAVQEVRRKQDEIGAGVLGEARQRLAAWGARAETELLVGDPATEILRLARDRNADLIVAGARGVTLIEGLLMGSVADRLLKDAPCSVLIVH